MAEQRKFSPVRTVVTLGVTGLLAWFIITHFWLIIIGAALVAGGGYAVVRHKEGKPILGKSSKQPKQLY